MENRSPVPLSRVDSNDSVELLRDTEEALADSAAETVQEAITTPAGRKAISATQTPVQPPRLILPPGATSTPVPTRSVRTRASTSSDLEPHENTPALADKVGRKAPTKTGRKPATKRKCATPTTGSQQKRSTATSASASMDSEMTDTSTSGVPPAAMANFDMKKYLDAQFSSMKDEMSCIKVDVAKSVKQINDRVDSNARNIDKITSELTGLDKKIAEAVAKETKKINGQHADGSSPTPRRRGGVPQLHANTDNQETRDYWRARRSIRCWPIRGPESDLWGLVGDFFHDVLSIPQHNLSQDSVESIRRLGNRRGNKDGPPRIQNEVCVVFKDVSTRDLVFSYASNLAAHRSGGSPPGIRLEFPDHLRGVFRTLETYGAEMRSRFGKDFKRSIKYDDAAMTLYIDVLFPGEQRWTKVDLEIADEELRKRRAVENESVRRRLGSLTEPTNIPNNIQPIALQTPNQLPVSTTLQQFNNPGPPSRWGANV